MTITDPRQIDDSPPRPEYKAQRRNIYMPPLPVAGVFVVGVAYSGYAGWLRWGGDGCADRLGEATVQGMLLLVVGAVIGMIPRGEDPRRKWFAFALLFGGWCLYSGVPIHLAARREREQVRQTKSAINRLSSSVDHFLDDSVADPTQRIPVPHVPQQTTWDVINAMTTKSLSEQKEINQLLQEIWTELNAQDIVARTFFSGRPEIESAIKKVDIFLTRFDDAEKRNKLILEQMEERVAGLKSDAGMTIRALAQFRSSFHTSAQESRALSDKSYTTSKKYGSTLRSILNFLLAKQGQYRVEAGELVWNPDVDVTRLHQLSSELDLLVNELGEIDREILERVDKGRKGVQELVEKGKKLDP